jgi:hypothetical protein
MKTIKKYKLTLLGVFLGALGGYLYYTFYGCRSGSCAITDNPFNSIAYGALVGGLLFSSIKSAENKEEKEG